MSIKRLGSPESSPEGCVIETSSKGGHVRVTVRAWHTPSRGNVALIPAVHFDLAEIAHFLGLRIPEKPKKARETVKK